MDKKQKLLKALEDGKIVDEKTLALYQILDEAHDEVEKMEEIKNEVVEKLDETTKKVEENIAVFVEKESQKIDEKINHIKNGVDGKDGKDGKHGRDGRDGKDGRDGLDGKDGKDGVNGKDGNIKDLSPQEVRDSLELLQDGEKLSIQAIQDLPKILEELKKRPSGTIGGGFSVNAMNFHIVDDELPTNTGDNLNFTIASVPSPASSLKVYRGGARLKITEDYTLSGRTITLLIALQTGEILTCDYRT